MKQSSIIDLQCIEKIVKYIDAINECISHFNINNEIDLKNTLLAQLAITQLITNIHETKNHIQKNTLLDLPYLKSINLKAARHIASHDYESISFEIIYRRCLQLTREPLINELNLFLKDNGK